MPISEFQSAVLRLLAAHRSPDSYIAFGIAINRHGPRFSGAIDIFHDSAGRLEKAVQADEAALSKAGYAVTWSPTQRTEKREATIEKHRERMQLEWMTDSAFRFFPTQPDDLFGYVLHPVDLATNKASAAADRRVPRDVMDLVTIHENVLPLGAIVAAAVGKFPGTTPEEFQALATEQPVDMPVLHRRIRSMIEDAESFVAKLPSDAVGVVFTDAGRPVQPDVNALDRYRRNPGAPGGLWPSSPEIGRAMLERYIKPKP